MNTRCYRQNLIMFGLAVAALAFGGENVVAASPNSLGALKESVVKELFEAGPFLSNPVIGKVIGKLAYEKIDEQVWEQALLGTFRPKHFEYFLFRHSKSEGGRFDIVFFDADGTGVYMTIPMSAVQQVDRDHVRFSFDSSGGGEAGSVKDVTTFDLTFDLSSDESPLHGILTTERIFKGVFSEKKRESRTLDLTFKRVSLAESVVALARSNSTTIQSVAARRLGY